MASKHAEIAGAGLAGLTLAAALGRAGWSVRVHERNPELREIGAGIVMWGNGCYVLRHVGAFEDATRGSDAIADWELRDEKNRVIQREWMLPGVTESFAILRTQLHQALARAAERAGAEIVTNSAVRGAKPDGTLLLASGEEVRGDLVIGADGINSPTREALGLANAVNDLGDGCGRHLLKRLPSDPKGQIVERWSGGRRIGVVPCTEQRTYVYLCCPAGDVAGTRQESDFSTWIETFPEFETYIRRIPAGGEWLPFGDVKATKWFRGRAAILGDAAHAMSPNLGQAACVGMMNAVTLVNCLEVEPTIEAALARWERQERPIADRTQRYSRFYGWIGTHTPRPLLSVRSGLVWTLANSKRAQAHINVAARYRPDLGSPFGLSKSSTGA